MKNYLCIIACIITFVSCNNNELEAKQDKKIYLEDVGALHNGALQVASYKTLTISSSEINLSGEAFNNLLIKSVEEKNSEIDLTTINKTALEIVKNNEFKSNYQAIVYDAITNAGLPNDLNATTNSPEIEDEFWPIGDTIMELFRDAYTKYPEKIEDYDFLVNEYIKIIEASNKLTDAEEEAIYTGFSVAAYTARYWDQESTAN